MIARERGERAVMQRLIERWYDEVWGQGVEESIFELMHPEAEFLGIGTVPIHGPEEFLPFWKIVRRNYADLRIDIDHLFVEGGQGLALLTTHCTRVISGQAVEMRGAVYFRVREGMLTFGRNVLDYLAILGQSDVLDLDIHQALFPIAAPGAPG